MTKVSCARRLSAIAAVAFSVAFLLVSKASADIIGIENSAGGDITLNDAAYSLTALEHGTESLTVSNSQSPTYLVDNDTASTSFTLTFTGTLAYNAFLNCQENGNFSNDPCTISGALGTVLNPNGGGSAQYGPPPGIGTNNWYPDGTITFNDVPTASEFGISFQSFAHAGTDMGTLTGMPESSSTLTLLATDLSPLVLFGLVGFLRNRRPMPITLQ